MKVTYESTTSLVSVLTSVVMVCACAAPTKDSVKGNALKAGEPNRSASAGAYSGLGKESVSAEMIAKFSPKSLPQEVTRTIQSMLDVRGPGSGILTPDGKSMYFGWNVTGTAQVWKIDRPLGFPKQMTGGQDSTSIADVTPDGKYLIVMRDRSGEENPGLYLQPIDGGKLVEIQHKSKVQTSFEWTTPDSKYIYYRSNDIKNDSYAIYKYEIATGKRELIFDRDGIWGIADHHPSANGKFILYRAKGSRAVELYLYNEATKDLQPIIGQEDDNEYDVSFLNTDGVYLLRTNRFEDFKRLYTWDMRVKPAKLTAVSANVQMDIEDAAIDNQRRRIYLSWNDQGRSRLQVLDAKTFKPIAFPKFPDADQMYKGRVSRDGRYATFTVETAKTPRQSYVFDWQTRIATPWTRPSAPEINTESFARAKLEFYPAQDGTQIPIWVRTPSKCEAVATNKLPSVTTMSSGKIPCPVLIHFHGGPEGQSRPGFSPWAQIFVDAGYIFVEPNVRGSDGLGKKWLDSDNGAKRLGVITDIEDAAIFARARWKVAGVEPKVGVMGGSYGGYSTLMAMSKFAGSYDAGVAIVGMSNLVSFLNNTAPYRRILRISEYGDPVKDFDALTQLSPITYVDKVKSPLMIIQGVNDPRVPAGEAIQIYDRLQARGLRDTGLMLFADEGHGSAKRENKVFEIGHTLSYFDKWLK